MPRAPKILLAGLAAAGLVACGSGGYAPTTLRTDAAPPTTPTTGPVAAAGPPASVVTMKGLAFAPPTTTIRVGQSVEWRNRDSVRHNVTALDGTTISSPDLAPGGRFVYVPVRPERVRYYCTIHPSTMSGELVVLPRAGTG